MHLLISSVRSHRCRRCEESISNMELYNMSLYIAYIWFKAIDQEIILLIINNSIFLLDIIYYSAKQIYLFIAKIPLIH